MKRFEVETKFVFVGSFYVCAESKEEARKIVKENCGMACGAIHSQLNSETVDWAFHVSPDRKISRILQRKQ